MWVSLDFRVLLQGVDFLSFLKCNDSVLPVFALFITPTDPLSLQTDPSTEELLDDSRLLNEAELNEKLPESLERVVVKVAGFN